MLTALVAMRRHDRGRCVPGGPLEAWLVLWLRDFVPRLCRLAGAAGSDAMLSPHCCVESLPVSKVQFRDPS